MRWKLNDDDMLGSVTFFWREGLGGFALEFFGGLDFGLGDAERVAVVDVEFHFVEDVGDDFVGL